MTFIKYFLSSLKPWKYPAIGGAIIGTPYGMYYGYNISKEYSLPLNVVGTIAGGVGGCFEGGLLGFFWPISIPVAISRNYKLEIKK